MGSETPHSDTRASRGGTVRRGRARRERGFRIPTAYRWAEAASEGLIYAMIVFSVWAFASIPVWAVWIMNAGGYLLGLLLVAKWVVRWREGFVPSRWDDGAPRWLIRALAALTVVLVAWCFVSSLNARATVNLAELRFEYRDHYIPWLPHSYDAPGSWFAAWQYLGLACSFWALRDWMFGKTRKERHAVAAADPIGLDDRPGQPASDLATQSAPPPHVGTPLPGRLVRLLWVVCLNGALVALEGILQRLSGTDRLLWVLAPPAGGDNRSQFGPFDYYANAAQYLNLVWPVCLAFWWHLRESSKASARRGIRSGSSPHLVLVPAVLLLFTAAVFAGSRGGALVALGLFGVCAGLLIVASKPRARRIGLVLIALFALVCSGGATLGGWQALGRLLAPPSAFPTGIEEGLSDFSLYYVLQCPKEGVRAWWELAYLPPGRTNADHGMAFFYVSRDSVGITVQGVPSTNRLHLVCTNFVGAFGGRQVRVAAVRSGTNLAVYAEGRRLPGTTGRSGKSLATNRVGSWFLRVQRDWRSSGGPDEATVHQVRLYDYALPESQAQALTGPSDPESGRLADPGSGVKPPVLDLDRRTLTRPGSLRSQLRGRTEIYRVGRRIASDFPRLGSGPGTFGSLFQLYVGPELAGKIRHAHNDWLQTEVTFGRIGMAMVLSALVLAVLCPCIRGRWLAPGLFVGLLWAALGGCLVHARFDYPFQVHSVLFLWLALAAMLSGVSVRRP